MAAIVPFIPSIISATGAIAGGILSRGGKKETAMQERQRQLVDELLSSLKGKGAFSNLFNADEATFQKSFVEPAKARFRNQIAPEIQAQYSGGQYGMQRDGTGIQDQLARAGVDMDQLLNQHFADFQQNAQNRQISAINSILGQGSGAPNEPTFGESLGQSAAGYLSSKGFQQDRKSIEDILSKKPDDSRKGFVPAFPTSAFKGTP